VSHLENCLILDLEDGSRFVDAMRIKAKDTTEIYNITEEIKKQGKPYRYIAIDTATALEAMCLPLALKLYKQTAMGKNYNDHILNLPNGAGYKYLRDAYEMVLGMIEGACERVLILGHLKDKIIDKAGKEVSSKDIDLTGKLRNITCAGADAIGYLFRDGNKNVLSFETTEDITCGARPAHLRHKRIVVSEYDPTTDILETHWDKIYID
jgi:hypothetical protein